ncbi:excisionase family DNA-binding protein [Microbacterium sp. CJ88]|uniref:excisionase family DNA-binding protein n=1 Tax=Microbacterium sp. CJ88 TaxID=3445672 RepID=UPI003F659280
MNRSQNSLALTYKDAAILVGVEYRTIKAGVDRGTIPTVQLGPRRMIPRAALLKLFGVDS